MRADVFFLITRRGAEVRDEICLISGWGDGLSGVGAVGDCLSACGGLGEILYNVVCFFVCRNARTSDIHIHS